MTHDQKEEWFINYNYLLANKLKTITEDQYNKDFERLKAAYYDKQEDEREMWDSNYDQQNVDKQVNLSKTDGTIGASCKAGRGGQRPACNPGLCCGAATRPGGIFSNRSALEVCQLSTESMYIKLTDSEQGLMVKEYY